ncbi:hypothetical protein [Nocardia noduli]|uniref:hypothetical protein n=1 Tax=Nocardia noduli TaxID=2815722 RepID=UPI001C226852|nr:hypothetical protein [Nocardia noduli]
MDEASDDRSELVIGALMEANGLSRREIRRMDLAQLRTADEMLRNFPRGWSDLEGQPLSNASYKARRLREAVGPSLRPTKYVVRRLIADLNQQEQVDEFKVAVEAKVQDPQLRLELSNLISEFAAEQQKTALEARSADANEKMRQAIHDAEMKERNWQRWKLMLDREPVAVLVGAVLLGILTLAIVGAMYSHTDIPEILASGFLLILGFFFGQAAGGGRTP